MSGSDKSTVDLDAVKKQFDDAVQAIHAAREAHDSLEKRLDGVDAEKLQKATDHALKALDQVQQSQQKFVAQAATIEAQEKRIEDLEKWLAKGGKGDGKGPANPEYGKAFNAYLRRKTPNFDQDAVAANLDGMVDLYYRNADEDTKSAVRDILGKTYVSGSLADGGFWVPVDHQSTMITRIFETSNLRPLAKIVTTATNEVVEGIDDDETGARWANELSAPVDLETPQYGELRIPIHEINGDIPITQHLIEDASRDVGAEATSKASDKFSRTENTSFVNGDGDGKPKGFLTYPEAADPDVYERGAVGILDVATDTAAGFAASDFINLQNLLKEPYQAGAVWTMKRRSFANVLTLTDDNGQFLLRFGDMFATGAGKVVLGNPVVFFDDMPAIADNALAVAYANFKEAYTIADRIGFSVMIDPYTRRPKVLWAFRKRVGGAVRQTDAIKLLRTNVT